MHHALAIRKHFAFRKGVLQFSGWKLKNEVLEKLKNKPKALKDDDFVSIFRQKRVDIKIGLDVAWLANKRIADRIILVTTDTDFVPAMKFARIEGVQIVIIAIDRCTIHPALLEHADEVRSIKSYEIKSRLNKT